MRKILITGAAGFIGSQLAYALWKQKETVVLLDDFSYGKEDNLVFEDHNFCSEIIRQDICEKGKIVIFLLYHFQMYPLIPYFRGSFDLKF